MRPGDSSKESPVIAADSFVLRGGIPLGNPFGVPVRVSLSSLFIYYVLALATLGENVVNNRHSSDTAYVTSLVAAVLLEASVFAHEIGHCVMARRLGLTVIGLRLWIFGGLSQVETEKLSPRREYAVAVIGPIVSLVIGGVCAALGLLTGERTGSLIGLTLFWLGAVNGLLGAYNMVPGLPFDGGRVLRAAVWGATGRATSGTRVAAYTGYAAAAGTAILALHVPAGASRAVVSLSVLPGLGIAAYIGLQAHSSLRAARVTDRAPLVSAGQLARRAFTTAADVPLAEAMRRAGQIGATSMIVTTSDGRPQALVSGSQLDGIPRERRPWIPVSDVALPITTGMVLDARLTGHAVLDALRRHPAGEYLVVEPAGQLLGVLAAIDVAAVLDPSIVTARRRMV